MPHGFKRTASSQKAMLLCREGTRPRTVKENRPPLPVSMAAPTVLTAFWVWGLLDKRVSDEYTSLYKPIPIPDKPTSTTHDITVITPVLNPEPSFLQCLEGYLASDPFEILVFTRPPYYQKVIDTINKARFSTQEIHVILANDNMPGMRGQMATGLLQARGAIIAKVDSHILWSPHYLAHRWRWGRYCWGGIWGRRWLAWRASLRSIRICAGTGGQRFWGIMARCWWRRGLG